MVPPQLNNLSPKGLLWFINPGLTLVQKVWVSDPSPAEGGGHFPYAIAANKDER